MAKLIDLEKFCEAVEAKINEQDYRTNIGTGSVFGLKEAEDIAAGLAIETGYTPEEARRVYEDMESRRCILLPVEVGTTVYKITSDKCFNYCHRTRACNSMPYSKECQGSAYVTETIFEVELYGWWGKSVFATEAEADAKLKADISGETAKQQSGG